MNTTAANFEGACSGSTRVPSSKLHDDPRVSAALEDYMARRASGEVIDREEWLAQHAEIRDALSECLGGLDLILAADPSSREPWQDAVALAGLRPATVLGDFRVLRELGRGGMGIVYEAEQISLGRRVALKVLPPSTSLDPRWRQRFQVEAQAAANLRHDHIVPVFAVGIERGVQYYAMPYIEGRTLSAVIHELRGAAGLEAGVGPEQRKDPALDSLTPLVAIVTAEETRLEHTGQFSLQTTVRESGPVHLSRGYFRWIARLGAQAAGALGHAHGLGIIHRDVKPSNLMVDHRGELWLTDFGLARFHDDDGLTKTGDLLGTLRYMSPEQAQARRTAVDHRTDIYSLGATLYELATLRPAFEGRDRQELLNRITLDEPTAPRRLNPSIPRDLETVILKAMAKDVPARYATARDLADDLNRFLDDRSIHARPPSSIDRVAKFTRRHRVSLLSGAMALIAALSVGSVLLWLEQRRTQQALDEVQAALLREQQSSKIVFDMADSLSIEAMARLSAITKVGSPEGEGFYVVALNAYEKIGGIYEHKPEMRRVAAEAFRRVGFVRAILRDYNKVKRFEHADVEGAYQKAIVLIRAEVAANPASVPDARLLAVIEQEYASSKLKQGGVDAAIPHLLGSLDGFRGLVRAYPGNQAALDELNQHRLGIIGVLNEWRRFDESTTLFRDALELTPGPTARNNLAWHLALRYPDKADQCAEALALALKATDEEPRNATYWHTLALARCRTGDQQGADAAIQKSMTLHDPDASDYAVEGLIKTKMGDRPGGQSCLQKALRTQSAADPDLQRVLHELNLALEKPPLATK